MNDEIRCRRCGAGETDDTRFCARCTRAGTRVWDAPEWKAAKEQQYAAAPEVTEIVRDLVGGVHGHLQSVYFYSVFLRDTPVSNGRQVWGRVKKVGGLVSYLMSAAYPSAGGEDPFCVLEISYPAWIVARHPQRVALVDHLLSLCSVNAKAKPSIGGYDVRENRQVLRRQGLWNDDLHDLIDAALAAERAPLFENAEVLASEFN